MGNDNKLKNGKNNKKHDKKFDQKQVKSDVNGGNSNSSFGTNDKKGN